MAEKNLFGIKDTYWVVEKFSMYYIIIIIIIIIIMEQKQSHFHVRKGPGFDPRQGRSEPTEHR